MGPSNRNSQNLRTLLFATSKLLMLGWLVAATACGATSTLSGIIGTVTDETAAPIAGATVTLAPTGVQATTDAQGAFSLLMPKDLPSYAVLTYSAPGYSTVTRSLLSVESSMQLLPVELRQAKMIPVTLPAAGEPPATVSNALADGGISLSIKAGDVVDAAGAPVTGDANIELTYWHPQAPQGSMPTLLLAAQNGTAPTPLKTFGMVNIAAEQNGNTLQIADGGNVTATFQVPPTLATLIHTSHVIPNLYALDTNVGLWVGVARGNPNQAQSQTPTNLFANPKNPNINGNTDTNPYASGGKWPGYAVQPYTSTNVTVTYDPNTGKYQTTLPYFAAWNVDGDLPTTTGGCVQGTIVNACSPKTGFIGQPVTFWALGFEQLARYQTVTDGASNYCVNVGISPYQAAGNGDPQDTFNYSVNYFVSGADIDDTSECDPLPASCHTCSDYYESFTAPFCNLCQLEYPGLTPFRDPTLPPPTAYADTCNPKTSQANLNSCHFCPGTAPGACTMPNTFDASNNLYANGTTYNTCTQLDTVVLRPPSCTCQYRGATCTASGCCAGSDGKQSACNGLNQCVACTKLRGQVCSQADGCCDPDGIQQLTCADNVCVPTVDPTYAE